MARNLVIVTVVKDDLDGLRLTLNSAGKSPHIDRWIVFDASQGDTASSGSMAKLIEPGVEYFNEPDRGPYDGMNKGIDLCDDEDYLWFMNAGDEFASLEAIQAIKKICNEQEPIWIVGSTIVEKRNRHFELIRLGNFSLRRYAYGCSTAYHQSTIATCSLLESSGKFDLKYSIAADYKITLKMAASAAPMEVDLPLSIYKAGGISDRNIRDNIRQQRQIRREILGTNLSQNALDTVYDLYRRLRIFARFCIYSFTKIYRFGKSGKQRNLRQRISSMKGN